MLEYFLYMILQDDDFFTEDREFWDPVKVTAKDTTFEFIPAPASWDCDLCYEHQPSKTTLPCCSQEMCKACVKKWFKQESVKCPFCRKDIREV